MITSDGTTYLEPIDENTMLSHYNCIDYMVDFGTKMTGYMQTIWELSEKTEKTTKSHVDMKATMEAIRGSVTGTKRSML